MRNFEISLNMKRVGFIFFIINFSFLIFNCSRRFEPEPLALSVKQNLALLQSDPQFVMYFNFQKMRETGFWAKFVSDSLFNSERNFGNFLYTLKQATGVSISNGIDELYFSNSWTGENAMVIKGTFDKNRINEYVSKDTSFSRISYPNNVIVYNLTPQHFYFYFKDDFTVCASNYIKQIESTFSVKDTSQTGLLGNAEAMSVIDRIKYKDNLWMMSDQKLFIRGIFENLSQMNEPGGNKGQDSTPIDSLIKADTSKSSESAIADLYQKINAVSFSLKMSDKLDLVMQNECSDVESAKDLKNRIDGIIALVRLSTQLSKKKSAPVLKVLDKLDSRVYEKTVLLELNLDEQQITDIRKQKIL